LFLPNKIYFLYRTHVLLGLIAYLYFTDHLSVLFNSGWNLFLGRLSKLEDWLISTTLLSILSLSIIGNWLSSILYGFIFPSTDKKILNNTQEIIEKQDLIENTITESNIKLDKLLENVNIDPRDIEQYLKALPIKNGKEETESLIHEWYRNHKISLDIREILIVVIRNFFEQNEKLSNEINALKLKGQTEFSSILENIQKHFQEGNAKEIRNEYYSRKEKIQQENIIILKQSIETTETLYAYKETKELYKELLAIESTHENYFNFAYFLQNFNFHEEAIYNYEEALKIRRDLAKENPRTYLPDVAMTLNNLAGIHETQNEFSKAIAEYKESLTINRDLAKIEPETYLPSVATNLHNLARFHSGLNEFSEALEECVEALKIRRDLAIKNPSTYLHAVAMTLNILANIHSDLNEFSEALEEYEEALKIYRELAKENPEKFLSNVALTLNNLAILHRTKNELSKALEEYNEVLEIRRNLAKENPRKFLPDVALTLNNLSILHFFKNEFHKALEECVEALKIYIDLVKESPNTYLPAVAFTLNNMANSHKAINEFSKALQEYEKALTIYTVLAKENPEKYLQNLADNHNNLAVLNLNLNEFPKALEGFELALEIYRLMAEENSSKYLPAIAMTLNNLANLHSKLNDFPKALEEYEEALNIRRDFAVENPEVYEIDYADMLITGVSQFEKDKNNLNLAKNILEKYPSVPLAQQLLEQIKELE
jgi:tetratricopeptide (TPR) repeat protein